MSYFTDIIKKEFRNLFQYCDELTRAYQVLEQVPPKQEEAEQRIIQAVNAAKIMEEEHELSQELYNTYPDVDLTQYGLPEPQDRPVDPVEEIPQEDDPEEEETTQVDEIEAPTESAE